MYNKLMTSRNGSVRWDKKPCANDFASETEYSHFSLSLPTTWLDWFGVSFFSSSSSFHPLCSSSKNVYIHDIYSNKLTKMCPKVAAYKYPNYQLNTSKKPIGITQITDTFHI